MITLRPDQIRLKAEIYQAFNEGALDVMGVAVTGFGKSVTSSDFTLDYNNAGMSQCIIAHRTELVGQMSLHVANRGIQHNIIAPKSVVGQITAEHRREYGRSFINPDAKCSVAGVDTLIARKQDLSKWFPTIDFVQTDEGHHGLKLNKWGAARGLFTRARGLWWTATPQRADGMGLGRHADGLIDTMCIGPDMRSMIDAENLCDYEIVCPASDLHIPDDVAPGGDYSQKKLAEASKKSHIVGDVVQNYAKYAFGKRAICFATDVETAHEIAANFNAAGIPAAAVSAKTPSETRAEYIRRFRSGQIWILVNVDLFGEGFDVPACEVVIMARPTASLGLYLQMFGRAAPDNGGQIVRIDYRPCFKCRATWLAG